MNKIQKCAHLNYFGTETNRIQVPFPIVMQSTHTNLPKGNYGKKLCLFCSNVEVVSTNHHHRPVWAHP